MKKSNKPKLSPRNDKSGRHARPCAGHPRLTALQNRQDVDGRVKPGHDHAVKPPVVDDDPIPADPDEFRLAFARKIYSFLGTWRRCREPICRRARRCAGADIACARELPPLRLTPERQARAIARMHAALTRVLAEREGEEGEQQS